MTTYAGDGWNVRFFDGAASASLPLSRLRRGDWVRGIRGEGRALRSWARVEAVLPGRGVWARGPVDREDGVYQDLLFLRPSEMELQAHPLDRRLPPGRSYGRVIGNRLDRKPAGG